MNKGLKLTDILVTIVIAIVFGIVYIIWASLYYSLAPFGLHLEQFIYGMWFIAGPVAYLMIRKPGVALLAEVAAASGEFLLGSPWGLTVLVSGLVQGIGAELVFLAARYKKFTLGITVLAAIGSCIASLIMSIFSAEILSLTTWNLSLLIAIRIIGSVLFAGVFAYYLVKMLEATGVTNLLRPATKDDYDALDEKEG